MTAVDIITFHPASYSKITI